jgi:hypothetical protein
MMMVMMVLFDRSLDDAAVSCPVQKFDHRGPATDTIREHNQAPIKGWRVGLRRLGKYRNTVGEIKIDSNRISSAFNLYQQ